LWRSESRRRFSKLANRSDGRQVRRASRLHGPGGQRRRAAANSGDCFAIVGGREAAASPATRFRLTASRRRGNWPARPSCCSPRPTWPRPSPTGSCRQTAGTGRAGQAWPARARRARPDLGARPKGLALRPIGRADASGYKPKQNCRPRDACKREFLTKYF
jgi:hypothetical protein